MKGEAARVQPRASATGLGLAKPTPRRAILEHRSDERALYMCTKPIAVGPECMAQSLCHIA